MGSARLGECSQWGYWTGLSSAEGWQQPYGFESHILRSAFGALRARSEWILLTSTAQRPKLNLLERRVQRTQCFLGQS